MAYIECNVPKTISYGEDILALSEDFKGIIDKLITTFDNIKVDEAWLGVDADSFIAKAKLEMEDYNNMYNSLKEIGETYIEVANAINSKIKDNNNE